MRDSFRQEFYKFEHLRAPLYGCICLILLMIYTAGMEGINSRTVALGFGMGQWGSIILSVIASISFGVEYQNNTIATLFYRNQHEKNVYISKLILIILYDFVLILIDIIFTVVITTVMMHGKFIWFKEAYDGKILLINFLQASCGAIGLTLLVGAIIIFLICLIRVTAVTVSLGLIMVFLAQAVSGSLVHMMGGVLRWNPLNMMNILNQILNPKFISITSLSIYQMSAGVIVYLLIFLGSGYLLFKRRK